MIRLVPQKIPSQKRRGGGSKKLPSIQLKPPSTSLIFYQSTYPMSRNSYRILEIRVLINEVFDVHKKYVFEINIVTGIASFSDTFYSHAYYSEADIRKSSCKALCSKHHVKTEPFFSAIKRKKLLHVKSDVHRHIFFGKKLRGKVIFFPQMNQNCRCIFSAPFINGRNFRLN